MDALGNPLRFILTGGECHESPQAAALIEGYEPQALIADKGYDAEARVLAPLREAGMVAVIPPKRNRKEQRAYDADLYEARHLIENFFCKLKQFRAIATRYDKRAINFLAGVYAASILIWLN